MSKQIYYLPRYIHSGVRWARKALIAVARTNDDKLKASTTAPLYNGPNCI